MLCGIVAVSTYNRGLSEHGNEAVFACTGFAFIAWVVASIQGFQRRCPECWRWFGRIKMAEEPDGREREVRQRLRRQDVGHLHRELRKEEVRGPSGDDVVRTREEERVRRLEDVPYEDITTTEHFLVHSRCRFCGHGWTTRRSKVWTESRRIG